MIRVTRHLHAGNSALVGKRDDSDEFKYVVAQTVGTFLGLLAIGFAVAAVLSERVRRVRADDERRFTSDKDVLGCFHCRPVSWVVFPWLTFRWLRSMRILAIMTKATKVEAICSRAIRTEAIRI